MGDRRDHFRTIFEASRTPIATADWRTLRFLDANAAYLEMVGYTLEELRARTPVDITVEEDGQRESELFQEVIEAARPAYSLEKRFVHKSGRIVWASVSVTVFRDDAGEVEYGVAICEDITARRAAQEERLRFEKEMLQAQKLESLGLLAGGVAHDFNNILVGIVGNAELARAEAASPRVAAFLDEVLESAGVAADLCRQILAYSGAGALQVEPLDLADTVRSGVRLLDSEKRAHVRFEVEEAGSLVVEADRNQLRQVVLNLVTNGLEAGGDVTVRVGRRTLEGDALQGAILRGVEGPAVCVEVRDDGVGMSAAQLERAFEPFPSSKGPGRGLGLSAVIGIARSHGATLRLRSALGEGTSVLLGMACSEAEIAHGATSSASKSPQRPRRILVVDDEPRVGAVIQRVLEGAGHTVETTLSVRAALTRLAEPEGLDAVVSDLTLPDGSGLDVLVAAERRGIPLLLVTGHSMLRLEEHPEVTVLAKPFRTRELLEALATTLGD